MVVRKPPRKNQRAAIAGTPLTDNPRCSFRSGKDTRCKLSSTVFRRLNWWCRLHDPGEPNTGNCGHAWSPLAKLGIEICGWCTASRPLKEVS